MGVTESQGVLKVFLSWERGARVNFNEPPGCVWHELVCGGAGERWGSWERLLISEERGVVGGRAVVVVADGLCGGQREGGLWWQPPREASEKGLVAEEGKSWTGVALGTALQKRERVRGPPWFQVAEVGQPGDDNSDWCVVRGICPRQSGSGSAANPVQCAAEAGTSP